MRYNSEIWLLHLDYLENKNKIGIGVSEMTYQILCLALKAFGELELGAGVLTQYDDLGTIGIREKLLSELSDDGILLGLQVTADTVESTTLGTIEGRKTSSIPLYRNPSSKTSLGLRLTAGCV